MNSTAFSRIGFFGGAFNPIHTGHLHIARNAYTIAMLDILYFVPTYSAPHKSSAMNTTYSARCTAIQNTIAGQKGMRLSNAESLLPEPSYTIRTKEYFMNTFPLQKLFFICGGSDFISIDTWYKGIEFLSSTNMIIAPRNTITYDAIYKYIECYTTIYSVQEYEQYIHIHTDNAEYIYMKIPSIPLSSTEIRTIS